VGNGETLEDEILNEESLSARLSPDGLGTLENDEDSIERDIFELNIED
jgi:hypothetical protein